MDLLYRYFSRAPQTERRGCEIANHVSGLVGLGVMLRMLHIRRYNRNILAAMRRRSSQKVSQNLEVTKPQLAGERRPVRWRRIPRDVVCNRKPRLRPCWVGCHLLCYINRRVTCLSICSSSSCRVSTGLCCRSASFKLASLEASSLFLSATTLTSSTDSHRLGRNGFSGIATWKERERQVPVCRPYANMISSDLYTLVILSALSLLIILSTPQALSPAGEPHHRRRLCSRC